MITPPLARQFTLNIEQARAIVANPTPQQSPFLRRLAWIALKHNQGTRVIQSRITAPEGPGAA